MSVYDKTGVLEFARALQQLGYELVSTGGTYKALSDEGGLPVQQVSQLTGFPEMMDGRVKTLHPKIHGGILARRDVPADLRELASHEIDAVDVVAGNLYPFIQAIGNAGVTIDEALENIDIGGPTMVRAAAKNFPFVVVVVDPEDYGWVADGLAAGGLSFDQRCRLAQKAFQHVAFYDNAVAGYLSSKAEGFPEELTMGYKKLYDLRYGENPHQKAAFYKDTPGNGGIANHRQLHGKNLSFNNVLDADAAWQVVNDFSEPTVAVVKHANPCGLAIGKNISEAYRRAFDGDPVSAFGGIVAFNGTVTAEAAESMRKVFYEIVLAPSYEPEALEVLRKKRDLRILEMPPHAGTPEENWDLKRVSGGVLIQTGDVLEKDSASWRVVTQREPTSEEMRDLAFAWKAVKHVKSNAIVLAKEAALVGMGAGQPNRVTSVHLALRIAGDERAKGSVLASDAFFPFSDSIEQAAKARITAVIQPGGSIRDQESIDAANRHDVAMVFTGTRHFKH